MNKKDCYLISTERCFSIPKSIGKHGMYFPRNTAAAPSQIMSWIIRMDRPTKNY